MNGKSGGLAPILVAIPDDWREEVCGFLEQEGYSLIVAATYREAIAIIGNRPLRGLITVSEWAVASEDSKEAGLLVSLDEMVPSLTLVRKIAGHLSHYMSTGFRAGHHEFCTLPADSEEFLARMRTAGMDAC